MDIILTILMVIAASALGVLVSLATIKIIKWTYGY